MVALYAPQLWRFPAAPAAGGWLPFLGGGFELVFAVFRKRSSKRQESAGPFDSRLFNLTHFSHCPVLDACPPPPLPLLLPLSLFGLCEPLSPGLERPSLPILDNCESLLIGLQRKRITWARNDVMAPGPSRRPPPLASPIKTKSSSAPNVLETAGLTLCCVSCMRAPGQTSVYVY